MKNYYKSIFMMLLSSLSFSLLTVLLKYIGGEYSIFAKYSFRLFVMVFIVIFSYLFSDSRNIKNLIGKREDRFFLFYRALIFNLGSLFYYYSASFLGVADSTAIYLTYPIFTALTGIILLGEKNNILKTISFLLGFSGVLLIVKPSFNPNLVPSLIALMSSLFLGFSYTLVTKAAKTRKDITAISIVFYVTFVGILITIPFLIYEGGFKLDTNDFFKLLLIGVFAYGIQIFSVLSYRLSPASEVSIFVYSSIVFSVILSALLFKKFPDFYSSLGLFSVFLGGYLIFLNNKSSSK